MLIDTHNHTKHFSPDAKMTIEELIETSSQRGLKVVAVTEHYEYDNPDPNDNIQTFDIEEYSKVFPDWQRLCPPSLLLLKGIEFGYQTHTAEAVDRIALEADLDTVVLSNHLFRGVDVCFSKEVYKLDKKARHREYIEKMAEMVEKCDNFCVAAHYDYVNKYNPVKGEEILYRDCPQAFDRFFETLIYKEKALEINTATSVKHMSKPDPEIIKRYLDMGGRLITLGSDAHVKENLGIAIADFYLYLASLGVKELCYFKSRKAQLTGLES